MSPLPNTTTHPTDERESTVIISAQTGLEGHRLRNFYITNILHGLVWMIFHFTVVYFFGLLLGNVILVGIFLGLANFVAFLLDIPLGAVQRYISTKRLFIYGAISQLIAVGIFFALIAKAFSIMQVAGASLGIEAATDWLFGNVIHWIGVFLAAICYGFTKEVNDVATFGYIMSNAKPKDTGIIIARMNITFGIGSVIGLILSGVILSLNTTLALILLGILISGLLFFMIRYFDNSIESIEIKDIQNFTVSLQKWNFDETKEQLSETIRKTDLSKIISTTKYLFLKPKKPTTPKDAIPWKEIMLLTRKEMRVIWKILSHTPMHYGLIWTTSLVLIFGFWDTFASSFLLDFLDDVKAGWSYILLAIIGVPGILLQEYAIKAGERVGFKLIGILGLILSGGSLLIMGFLAMSSSISAFAIIAVALINSVGYACGMAVGQNEFLSIYNMIYAKQQGLQEIDANASSGPMKVLQNLANVVGLTGGGLLLAFGFPFFFFSFAVVVFGVLFWTFRKKQEIHI